MRSLVTALMLALAGVSAATAKVVVFWQDGFPTAASQPLSRVVLTQTLDAPVFAGIEALRDPATLSDTDLLVLPYGSAFPTEDWSAIRGYLRAGGNLLILGGQPFRVPVATAGSKFVESPAQDTYSRELDLRHTYELPPQGATKFAWKSGYSFLPAPAVRARRFFALQGGLDGLGYMVDAGGVRVAAPVVVADHSRGWQQDPMLGARIVMLDFEPEPGLLGIAGRHRADSRGGRLRPAGRDRVLGGHAILDAEAGRDAAGRGASAERAPAAPGAGRDRRSQNRAALGRAPCWTTARVACSGPKVDAQVSFKKSAATRFLHAARRV